MELSLFDAENAEDGWMDRCMDGYMESHICATDYFFQLHRFVKAEDSFLMQQGKTVFPELKHLTKAFLPEVSYQQIQTPRSMEICGMG